HCETEEIFVSNDFYSRLPCIRLIWKRNLLVFHSREEFANSGIHVKQRLLAAVAVRARCSSFTVNAAENDKPQYLSDWWHQSVNVVGSYHTRFGPQIRNDTAYSALFDHGLASKSDQRFAYIRSTGNLTFSTAF